MAEFRWNDWNSEHATRHGVSIREIESVVASARRPYPKRNGEKWLVIGRGQGNRMIEVVYLHDPDRTIFVIHAMPLTMRRRKE